MKTSARRSRGFSMVELLVSVLVLGIGVLGVAGLQVHNLQQNRAALHHGEAVHLAYDIVDRIRSNPTGRYAGLEWGDEPAVAADCTARACDVAELTAFDHAVWKCRLGDFHAAASCTGLRAAGVIAPAAEQPGLPSGDGRIARSGNVLIVSVRWREANSTTPTEISVQTQL